MANFKNAGEVRAALEKAMKQSRDDSVAAIAAALLSLMGDIVTVNRKIDSLREDLRR